MILYHRAFSIYKY